MFKEKFSFKFKENLKIQNKYYVLKCKSYTPQNWWIGLKWNSILFLIIRCQGRDQIYPGGNPKWRWQSGLRSRLFHLIKRESLMISLRQYCLDFPIFTMTDSKFHFSPTFTSNLFFWTRNKNDIHLKHITSSTLVKCNSMIISIVMPSYPNVTLFHCHISEHWTTARTLNMTINHKFP